MQQFDLLRIATLAPARSAGEQFEIVLRVK
jgi:hypothetical protein